MGVGKFEPLDTHGWYKPSAPFLSLTQLYVGSLSMIVPMYVAECAPPEVRGLLISVQQFAIEFGIMISFWIVSTRPSS